MSSGKLKTRSALYLRQMSDTVQAQLEVKSKDLNIAKWLLVEKILESALGIPEDGVDVAKWLGINNNNARTGKPFKKKLEK